MYWINLLKLKTIQTYTPSRKHAYIIMTLLNPTLNSKTGVYRGIHYFSYFAKNIYCIQEVHDAPGADLKGERMICDIDKILYP